MKNHQQRTQELAHQIWESEGRPHNQAHRHWDAACNLIAAENINSQPVSAVGNPSNEPVKPIDPEIPTPQQTPVSPEIPGSPDAPIPDVPEPNTPEVPPNPQVLAQTPDPITTKTPRNKKAVTSADKIANRQPSMTKVTQKRKSKT